MAQVSRSQKGAAEGNPDRDYRAIGWWGVALVACGILALIFAASSFSLE